MKDAAVNLILEFKDGKFVYIELKTSKGKFKGEFTFQNYK